MVFVANGIVFIPAFLLARLVRRRAAERPEKLPGDPGQRQQPGDHALMVFLARSRPMMPSSEPPSAVTAPIAPMV